MTPQFNFSDALEQLKQGKLLTRRAWNGKDQFIYLVDGSKFEVNRPPLKGIFAEGTEIDYHSLRIIYRTEIIGGDLRDETDESTDMAAWFTHEDAVKLPLLEFSRVGVELAFPSTETSAD